VFEGLEEFGGGEGAGGGGGGVRGEVEDALAVGWGQFWLDYYGGGGVGVRAYGLQIQIILPIILQLPNLPLLSDYLLIHLHPPSLHSLHSLHHLPHRHVPIHKVLPPINQHLTQTSNRIR
jgi:hypothetical protein